MSEQKEIEEMTKAIESCSQDCSKCRHCVNYVIAEKLYHAGYRKINDSYTEVKE